jgi:hypothetical protein
MPATKQKPSAPQPAPTPLTGAAAVDAAAGRKFVTPVDTARGPYSNAQAITPSDTADLGFITLALFIGSGGDVAVNLPDGSPITLAAVPAGTTIPIRASRVLSTGTGASSIVAMW